MTQIVPVRGSIDRRDSFLFVLTSDVKRAARLADINVALLLRVQAVIDFLRTHLFGPRR